MGDYGKLRSEILLLLTDQVRDLWEEEDRNFLEQLAEDIAREKFLAVTSPTPQEHEKNLAFLAATLQGEITKRRLRLNKKGREIFVRVLITAIKTVAIPALGVV